MNQISSKIVVTGLGAVCPLGADVETIWKRLIASETGIGFLPEDIASDLPCKVGSLVAARFDLEKEKGNLPDDFPSEDRARLLHDMRQGHVHRSRAGWTAKRLLSDLEDRIRMVLLV